MHPITYGPSDPTLPLTVIEWEEWGDPLTDPAALANMLSYSPVDNVASQRYPHLLLTAGLHDPRVAFWEPAKFAAKASAGEGGRKRLGRECIAATGTFKMDGCPSHIPGLAQTCYRPLPPRLCTGAGPQPQQLIPGAPSHHDDWRPLLAIEPGSAAA